MGISRRGFERYISVHSSHTSVGKSIDRTWTHLWEACPVRCVVIYDHRQACELLGSVEASGPQNDIVDVGRRCLCRPGSLLVEFDLPPGRCLELGNETFNKLVGVNVVGPPVVRVAGVA